MNTDETRRRARVAWLLWIACACCIAAALCLAVINDVMSRETGLIEAGGNAGLALAFGTIGALIAIHHERNPVGWLLLAIGIHFAIGGFAGEYTTYAFVAAPGDLPGGEAVAWINAFKGEVTSIGLVALILLLFPTGRLPSSPWRIVGWMAVGGIGLSMLAAFRPGPFRNASYPPTITNPLGIAGADPMLGVAEGLGMGLMLLALVLAMVAVGLRFRHAQDSERRQIWWLVLGAAAILGFMLSTQLLMTLPRVVEDSLFYLSFAALPLTIGIALMKHEFYDVELIINRALVWGAMTTFVIGFYVLVVALVGEWLQTGRTLPLSLVATGIVALLFQPLREQLQRGVNRLLYGDRDDPYSIVAHLGQRVEAALAPDTVLPTIVETVAQALKLPYAAIALQHGPSHRVAASYGTPRGELLTLPLYYQAEPVGELALAPRAPNNAFDTADRRLLQDLARQIGVAAHAVRLTADLQQSRERLVTAREEERRRLRRDLHDGLGPSLASITLKLDAARNFLPSDPVTAEAHLVDLKAQVQAALTDIRRVVHDLRPPALDELGLVSAIREHAARITTLPHSPGRAQLSVPTVRVDACDDLPPLTAAVEVAAFRIVLEGLTNALRHASARQITIRLVLNRYPAQNLRVEIIDDGRGFGPATPAGVGLTSMRERAEELGGTLTVAPGTNGGTTVTAQLPLPLGVTDP